MSSEYVPINLRKRLRAVSGSRCSYCRSDELLLGAPLEVEHIIPRAKDGETTLSNLCLACHRCNQFKGDRIEALDAVSGESIPLFHPRSQSWHDHFQWSESGLAIIGKTPCGRATVTALQLNNDYIVGTRRVWIGMKLHPPID